MTARALALDIGSAEKAKAWNQATAKVGRRCSQAAFSQAFRLRRAVRPLDRVPPNIFIVIDSLSIASLKDELGIYFRKTCLPEYLLS